MSFWNLLELSLCQLLSLVDNMCDSRRLFAIHLHLLWHFCDTLQSLIGFRNQGRFHLFHLQARKSLIEQLLNREITWSLPNSGSHRQAAHNLQRWVQRCGQPLLRVLGYFSISSFIVAETSPFSACNNAASAVTVISPLVFAISSVMFTVTGGPSSTFTVRLFLRKPSCETVSV
jgi:hypothetical protein